MQLQEPAEVMMVGSLISRLPHLGPSCQQITSTTLEVEGVRLVPQQLQELKALTTEQDDRRGPRQWQKRIGAWPAGPCPASFSSFVHPFQASLPAAPLLSHVHHAPAPSETLLVKVLVTGQNKSLEAIY